MLVLLYSSRRRNKSSELSYEAELSCLSKSSISLAREEKNSAIFGSQQTTTLDRKSRLGEVKTSIDITTGQRSLFRDSSTFFFKSTRIFFRLKFQNFDSCFFFVREQIFCNSRLMFFIAFDVLYKFRLKYYVFNMFLLLV